MNAAESVLWEVWVDQFAAHRTAYVLDSRETIHEPITPQLCEAYARDGHAISGYLAALGPNGGFVTSMGAIDIDTTIEDAVAIRRTLTEHGVRTLMALSRRGAHLWVWSLGDGEHQSQQYLPVPASRMRRGLQAAVDLTIKDAEVRSHIEVFPKHSDSAFGVGALRMPLFQHPKTGVVYPVVNEAGAETTDRLEAYRWTIPMDTPYNALYGLGGAKPTDVTYPTDLGRQRRPVPRVEGPGVTSLLHAMGQTKAQPGRSVRCPFHEDRHASLSVSTDDQRVWCKAPACPIHNGGRGIGSLALAKLKAV